MKGGKRPLGYTIIEVMIVLAVSGVMFVIAASFISGKEESTAFTEGTNEFASQLQTIIAQVVDGQYSDISFSCAVNPISDGLSFNKTAPQPNSTQGTNSACDFLGKFMHFSEANDPTAYEVFSLANARTSESLTYVTPVTGDGIDLTVQQTIPQSLQVQDVKVTDSTTGIVSTSYGIGFTQSQGSCLNNNCITGAQTVNMIYSPGLDAPNGATLTESEAKIAITGHLSTASAAVICLTDGNRYAKISLGNSSNASSPLYVNVMVMPKPYAVTPPC